MMLLMLVTQTSPKADFPGDKIDVLLVSRHTFSKFQGCKVFVTCHGAMLCFIYEI